MSDNRQNFERYFRDLSDTIRAQRGYTQRILHVSPQKQENKRQYEEDRIEYDDPL